MSLGVFEPMRLMYIHLGEDPGREGGFGHLLVGVVDVVSVQESK